MKHFTKFIVLIFCFSFLHNVTIYSITDVQFLKEVGKVGRDLVRCGITTRLGHPVTKADIILILEQLELLLNNENYMETIETLKDLIEHGEFDARDFWDKIKAFVMSANRAEQKAKTVLHPEKTLQRTPRVYSAPHGLLHHAAAAAGAAGAGAAQSPEFIFHFEF